jgi:hypothetical protein
MLFYWTKIKQKNNMNKKIITLLCITIITSLHGMERIENIPGYGSFDEKKSHQTIDIVISKNEYDIIIWDKTSYFYDITKNPKIPFAKKDHTNSWYITSVKTLLSIKSLQKIEDLINIAPNIRNSLNNNLLKKIAFKRRDPFTSHQEMYLTLAQFLLDHGADPDFRLEPNDPTPLMVAVCRNDKPYAHSLVWYNADPYKKGIWLDNSLKNSFEVEEARDNCEKDSFEMEPTGWLQQMVNEREKTIFKCWLFKNCNIIQEYTFVPELVQLIICDLWHICKTYDEKQTSSCINT